MRSNAILPISGAVLAGGESRRMGTDKALVPVDGMPMLGRVLAALSQVSMDVYVVGERKAYHRFGAAVVRDSYPGTGPLGGIATAIEHARFERVIVVACDMPFVNPELLRAMVDEAQEVDAVVPRITTADGVTRFEPLHAIYSPKCLPVIRARLDACRLTVAGFLDDVTLKVLENDWIQRFDPELRSFINANTSEELQRAFGGSGVHPDRATEGGGLGG